MHHSVFWCFVFFEVTCYQREHAFRPLGIAGENDLALILNQRRYDRNRIAQCTKPHSGETQAFLSTPSMRLSTSVPAHSGQYFMRSVCLF